MANEIILIFLTFLFTLLLYRQNSVFKFYAKYAVFGVGCSISTLVFIPLMLFKPGDYRNGILPMWGFRQVSKLIGIRWKLQGQENILQDEGSVILINHQSFLDLIAMAYVWKLFERCKFISKAEVFYLWPFGLGAWLWGTVFIDRSSRKHAQESVNKVATKISSKKLNDAAGRPAGLVKLFMPGEALHTQSHLLFIKAKICMFPEGTRHGGETLKPFKKGAFHIAIEAQAPIQPLVVKRYTFLDYDKRRFDYGSSVMSILPAIPTKGLTKNDLDKLIDKTYKAMSEEYARLNSNS